MKKYGNKLEVNEHGIAGFKLILVGGLMLCANMFQNSPYAGIYVVVTIILFIYAIMSEIRFIYKKISKHNRK